MDHNGLINIMRKSPLMYALGPDAVFDGIHQIVVHAWDETCASSEQVLGEARKHEGFFTSKQWAYILSGGRTQLTHDLHGFWCYYLGCIENGCPDGITKDEWSEYKSKVPGANTNTESPLTTNLLMQPSSSPSRPSSRTLSSSSPHVPRLDTPPHSFMDID